MLLSKTINNWLTHAKKYFFTYKNGFYEVSYLGNSPAYLVSSVKKMPFVKYDNATGILATNNPFAKGTLEYQEIEEGLWVTYSEMEYKQNFAYKVIYDKFIPCDYYLLSYNINTNEAGGKAALLNNIEYDNKNWSLFKPKFTDLDCHFKNTRGNHITVFFSKDWLQKNLLNGQLASNSRINEYFYNENVGTLVWPDISETPIPKIQALKNTLCNKRKTGVADILQLKADVLSFFGQFADIYETENLKVNHFEIPNNDRVRTLKVEKYLSENLNNKFEGIEDLAAKFNISPTKLKSDFKLVFGKPIFQYFQELQMRFAKELLKNEDIRIKELAARFGYENAGKFSQAYKKHFDILPSEFLKSENY